MSQPYTAEVNCRNCGEIIEDLAEAEHYGEEINHVECPEPVNDQPLAMPGPAALFVMAARGLRSPWED